MSPQVFEETVKQPVRPEQSRIVPQEGQSVAEGNIKSIRKDKNFRRLEQFFQQSKAQDPEVVLRELSEQTFGSKQRTKAPDTGKSEGISAEKKQNNKPEEGEETSDYASLENKGKDTHISATENEKKDLVQGLSEQKGDEKKLTPEEVLKKEMETLKGQLALSQERYHELALSLAGALGFRIPDNEDEEKEPQSFFQFLLYLVALLMQTIVNPEEETKVIAMPDAA